jgi:endoribonuclease Dicer
MTCYERLEFLGDAILDFCEGNFFYANGVLMHYSGNTAYFRSTRKAISWSIDVAKGIFNLSSYIDALTSCQGAMVSNSALAAISVYYGLHKFVILESESVKKSINEYVPEIEEKQRAEYAAAKEEGRSPGQYWLDVEPPKACDKQG